jgi:WD40 repeat protein
MMSMHPQPTPNRSKQNKRKQKKSGQQESYVQHVHEIQYQLQEALRHGLAVENILWSSRMTDWIVGLHAADIDGDGNMEIAVGSRDGWVRVFTRFGSLKWEYRLKNAYLSALVALPLKTTGYEKQPAVVLGLRSGKVIALDKDGNLLKGWAYNAERIVRRIAICNDSSAHIVIGSEDRSIHVLDTAGKLCWKYHTQGWIRSVFVADIDGDGQEEVLAGSGDKKLYIFNTQGQLLYTFDTGYRIYALYAAQLEPEGPMSVIMSSSRKDLMAWHVKRINTTEWRHDLIWFRSPEDGEYLFANRVQSIGVHDINMMAIVRFSWGQKTVTWACWIIVDNCSGNRTFMPVSITYMWWISTMMV